MYVPTCVCMTFPDPQSSHSILYRTLQSSRLFTVVYVYVYVAIVIIAIYQILFFCFAESIDADDPVDDDVCIIIIP